MAAFEKEEEEDMGQEEENVPRPVDKMWISGWASILEEASSSLAAAATPVDTAQ